MKLQYVSLVKYNYIVFDSMADFIKGFFSGQKTTSSASIDDDAGKRSAQSLSRFMLILDYYDQILPTL